MLPTVLVTGGAGFIASNFVLLMVHGGHARVVNVDKLTYAGNLENLASLRGDSRHVFVRGDICNRALMKELLDRTYGLPTITTNCSNNYGPYQFPEKLVPLCILNALENRALPVYGDGGNIRDWSFAQDHCEAMRLALANGCAGETYGIGARAAKTNLEVVEAVCCLLDELAPPAGMKSHRDRVTFVPDRPGHDPRYAVDPSKAERTLGWVPKHDFASGLRSTVHFYLEHRDWCARVAKAGYHGERLGLAARKVES